MGGRWEDGLIQSSVPAITRILRNLNQMLTTANNRQATSNRQATTNNQQATSRSSNLCCTFDQLLEQTHTLPAAGWAGNGAPGSAAGRTSQAFDEQKVADCKSKSNLPYGCHSLQIVRAQNLTMTQTQTLAGLQQQQQQREEEQQKQQQQQQQLVLKLRRTWWRTQHPFPVSGTRDNTLHTPTTCDRTHSHTHTQGQTHSRTLGELTFASA